MQYRVHGYCLVPCEAEIVVKAASPVQAKEIALQAWCADRRSLIVGNSADDASACDWEPTVEPLLPNAEITGG